MRMRMGIGRAGAEYYGDWGGMGGVSAGTLIRRNAYVLEGQS